MNYINICVNYFYRQTNISVVIELIENYLARLYTKAKKYTEVDDKLIKKLIQFNNKIFGIY